MARAQGQGRAGTRGATNPPNLESHESLEALTSSNNDILCPLPFTSNVSVLSKRAETRLKLSFLSQRP